MRMDRSEWAGICIIIIIIAFLIGIQISGYNFFVIDGPSRRSVLIQRVEFDSETSKIRIHLQNVGKEESTLKYLFINGAKDVETVGLDVTLRIGTTTILESRPREFSSAENLGIKIACNDGFPSFSVRQS